MINELEQHAASKNRIKFLSLENAAYIQYNAHNIKYIMIILPIHITNNVDKISSRITTGGVPRVCMTSAERHCPSLRRTAYTSLRLTTTSDLFSCPAWVIILNLYRVQCEIIKHIVIMNYVKYELEM